MPGSPVFHCLLELAQTHVHSVGDAIQPSHPLSIRCSILISFRIFQQFSVIHTVKAFGIVNKAEVDVFLELSCFFDDPADVASLISGSSAFSKTFLNIWKFTVHVLLKLAWRI